MIDDVYLHETVNDKGTRLINSLKKIKNSRLFKVEGTDNMVDATMNKQETVKKPISTASVADNITFETLLDTQFFASKINKAVELQSQVGHLKDGKLCSYDNEIESLISEIEKFSQSSTSDSDVAKQYVKQLSVWKLSDLYDCFREMIIKCVKIGISKDAIMQFINKALEIGLLDKERFTNIKEITTALLDKRNQDWQVFYEIRISGKAEQHILPEQLRLWGEFLLYCILNSNIPQFRLVVWWCGQDFIPLQRDWKSEMTEFLITQIHHYKPKSTSNERTDLRWHS